MSTPEYPNEPGDPSAPPPSAPQPSAPQPEASQPLAYGDQTVRYPNPAQTGAEPASPASQVTGVVPGAAPDPAIRRWQIIAALAVAAAVLVIATFFALGIGNKGGKAAPASTTTITEVEEIHTDPATRTRTATETATERQTATARETRVRTVTTTETIATPSPITVTETATETATETVTETSED